MVWAILGVTLPVVGAIVSTAWRLAVRLDRIETAISSKLPTDPVVELAKRAGYVWVLDLDGNGHWYPDATLLP